LIEEVALRTRRTIIGVAGGLSCLIGGALGFAATAVGTPAGGPIHVFIQPGTGQRPAKIVITGAVGDFGTLTDTRKDGRAYYTTANLRNGTIVFDLTAILTKLNSALPTVSAATCSVFSTTTGPTNIVRGTGSYKGIGGTVDLTQSVGTIATRRPSDHTCNLSAGAQPAAQMTIGYGTGVATF
jgi:hypothetical protein